MLRWAVEQAVAVPAITHVVAVVPADHLVAARRVLADVPVDTADRSPGDPPPGEPVRPGRPGRPEARGAEERGSAPVRLEAVVGGPTRRESVARGLAVLPESVGLVLVHDAARAFAPPALFGRVIDALRAGSAAVVPGLPVVDTIKQVDDAQTVVATPPRASLRAVQTPQGFVRGVLEHAHAAGGGEDATDDAGLVERSGHPIHVVAGETWAAKVTTRDDLDVAAWRVARAAEVGP